MTSASDALRDEGPGSASEDRSASRYDLLSGIGCYVLWSGLSLLFMALAAQGAGPGEILASRCLWSLPWAFGILLLTRGGPEARAILGSPRTLLWLAASATLVSGNWAMFIWASTNGHKLDASLAYYINPLLNMGAGALLFRERFSRTGAAAIVLACIGVALQGLAVGHPPWLALALALSFWGYGVLRKQAPAGAQAGLFVECLMLAPLGLAYLVWIGVQGRGHLGAGLPADPAAARHGPGHGHTARPVRPRRAEAAPVDHGLPAVRHAHGPVRDRHGHRRAHDAASGRVLPVHLGGRWCVQPGGLGAAGVPEGLTHCSITCYP